MAFFYGSFFTTVGFIHGFLFLPINLQKKDEQNRMYFYIFVSESDVIDKYIQTRQLTDRNMGWLRLVGSLQF